MRAGTVGASLKQIGIFFLTDKSLLVSSMSLDEAEEYGNFLTYPRGHWEVWEEEYESVYQKSYDYYPRGRVVYDSSNETFVIYKDSCIPDEALSDLVSGFQETAYRVELDEHYKCNKCNPYYVDMI